MDKTTFMYNNTTITWLQEHVYNALIQRKSIKEIAGYIASLSFGAKIIYKSRWQEKRKFYVSDNVLN